ncbi:MAG: hypothetical protein AAFX87_12605 [Bacteroidota bacterium]
MPKQQTDHLVQLINSLSKAEKRNFKLFVGRNQAAADAKFIQLFNVMDKMKEYDEQHILKTVPGIKKSQLSNIKANLYKQLLLSLRLNHRHKNDDIEIREKIDYARILYNKGLYKQSLELLDNVKEMAKSRRFNLLTLEIIEFEKQIELQYITRSIATRSKELSIESASYGKMINSANRFSNLALRLYDLYLKTGHARNEKDYYYVKDFFISNLPEHDTGQLSFYEKLYLYMAQVWYNYIIQDFLKCYKYAEKWVSLIESDPAMKEKEVVLYLKGIHNLLSALYNIAHYSKFVEILGKLKALELEREGELDKNIENLLFLYRFTHEIDRHFLEGTFTEGLRLIPDLLDKLESKEKDFDQHRIIIFYYRAACLYFGAGDNQRAIYFLNKIINLKESNIREDIQCFSRILNLIAHYELGNQELVEYQIKSVYRFLVKMKDLQAVQSEILRFLRKVPKIFPSELRKEFIKLKGKLKVLSEDEYEKRPFVYLDIVSWLESKINNRPVEEIIRNKYLTSKRR